MLLHTLIVGTNETNCYIVGSEEESRAAVIDPGAESRRIFDVIGEQELDVVAIICTHGHYDHAAGVDELAELTGANIYAHKKDAELLKDPVRNLSSLFGVEFKIDKEINPVEDGDEIAVGEMRLKVLHTPGHTPGGISIIAGEGVFCGDLVFANSVGRTDFPGGSWGELLRSVTEKIFTLPERLKLYPGHGPSTSIGEERAHNPYLAGL